eukprot:3090175-Karenia_brevis.AAC.1
MVVKTQHLVDIAGRDNYNTPCYYLRGPQPIANTTPTREPYRSAYGSGLGQSFWQGPMTIYTDGSGGPYSQDRRLKRCGRAWVVNSANAGLAILLWLTMGNMAHWMADKQCPGLSSQLS